MINITQAPATSARITLFIEITIWLLKHPGYPRLYFCINTWINYPIIYRGNTPVYANISYVFIHKLLVFHQLFIIHCEYLQKSGPNPIEMADHES